MSHLMSLLVKSTGVQKSTKVFLHFCLPNYSTVYRKEGIKANEIFQLFPNTDSQSGAKKVFKNQYSFATMISDKKMFWGHEESPLKVGSPNLFGFAA